MFSENGKISEKQMRRMLILPLYASLVFVVPQLSAWLFGESIVPGLITFFVFACIYVGCMYGLSAWVWKTGRIYGVSICDWERQERTVKEKKAGSPEKSMGAVGRLLILLQVLRLIVRLVFYVCLSIEVLKEGQVPFMPHNDKGNVGGLFVVLPLLLTALYGAGKYMEKQGRIYELIFWILYIPLVLVLLFGIWEVDFSVFVPKWNLSFGVLMFRGYLLLTFLLPVENYILLRPFLQAQAEDAKRKNGKKYPGAPSFFAVIGTVLLVCVLTLVMLGIYGVHGAGSEEMLTVSIMRYIRLPLGFVERVDVLLIWFFMIGCFVLIGQTLYFSGMLLSAAFPKIRRGLLLLAVLVTAMVIVVFLPGYGSTLWLYRSYGAAMDLPLSLILPLIGVFDIQSLHDREKWNVKKGGNDNAVS